MKGFLIKFNFVQKLLNRRIFSTNIDQGVMAVEIKNTIGLGARLSWVLEILAFCEEHNLRPAFRFTCPGSDSDFFKPFFAINERVACRKDAVQFVKIHTIGELDLGRNYDDVLTVATASRLIKKYLLIQDDIQQEVETFCSAHHFDNTTLGVHYRGTDKSAEAPSVSYENMEQYIRHYVTDNPAAGTVFVATDDANFLQFIQQSSVADLVVSRDDSFRATDNVAIHFSGHDRYALNRDAIVNCLLLSRCHALLKTASILSGWSVLFNPDIRVMMLNKPFDNYFPEREFTIQDSPLG
jgi:hypothetical protein